MSSETPCSDSSGLSSAISLRRRTRSGRISTALSRTTRPRNLFSFSPSTAAPVRTVNSKADSRHEGYAFTGSGAEASCAAFDKVRAREALSARGVRVADACLVDGDSATHEKLARLFETHGKVVVKPVFDGSSHGVRFIETEKDLNEVIVDVRRQGGAEVLAEAFIAGRELTVAVCESADGRTALPCSEVRLDEGRTFDYEGKYLGKGALELTPAPVSDDVASAAQSVALTAHEALGCYGYSRTDVIIPDRPDRSGSARWGRSRPGVPGAQYTSWTHRGFFHPSAARSSGDRDGRVSCSPDRARTLSTLSARCPWLHGYRGRITMNLPLPSHPRPTTRPRQRSSRQSRPRRGSRLAATTTRSFWRWGTSAATRCGRKSTTRSGQNRKGADTETIVGQELPSGCNDVPCAAQCGRRAQMEVYEGQVLRHLCRECVDAALADRKGAEAFSTPHTHRGEVWECGRCGEAGGPFCWDCIAIHNTYMHADEIAPRVSSGP